MAHPFAWSMAAVSEATVGVLPSGVCPSIALLKSGEVVESGPISTFGIRYESTRQAALFPPGLPPPGLPLPMPLVGKKRRPTPKFWFCGSLTKALRAALTTDQRDSTPMGGGPPGMSHLTPLSGTGQFIDPVVSTMKYRSTGTA